jgi:methylmalonyl-CoA epimerase
VLDAAGYDVVIIETVGVGQDEVDIVRTADVSVVTIVPGTGDEVQALKAGIMEIADIFVVNKADREGADRTAASIEAMLSLEEWGAGAWRPPVLRTVATTSAGVADLIATIDKFREYSATTQRQRRRARAEWRLRELLERRFMTHVEHDVLGPADFATLVDRVTDREIDPYRAASDVMTRALREPAPAATGTGGDGVTLDHVGIAVREAAPYVDLFHAWFGLRTDEPEDVGAHRVRFIDTGDATLELVEPLTPDSPVAKFLDKRGAGLHHVCVRVRDIEATMTRLQAQGVKFIDQQPRQGAHGSRIAFIHPSSALGLLLELKQRS